MRKKREKMTTDAEIEERLKKREEMREKRAEDARTGRGDIQMASARRNERWRKQELKRYNDLKKNEEEKEQYIQKVLQQKEQERKKLQIQRRLREEEKIESAHRLDRQRQKRLDNLKERMDNTMQRVENIQAEKQQMHKERQVMLSQLERERDQMTSTMREAVVLNRTDPRSIKRLADLYGIDLAAIQQKAKKGTMMSRRSENSNLFITSTVSSTRTLPRRNLSSSSSTRTSVSMGGTRSKPKNV
ncbi:hypothetical protein M9Y10_042518 [Tritrichomonas musculus]